MLTMQEMELMITGKLRFRPVVTLKSSTEIEVSSSAGENEEEPHKIVKY